MSSAIGPGDLVEVIRVQGVDYSDRKDPTKLCRVQPGLQGVALSGPILPPLAWAHVHLVRFPAFTSTVVKIALRKVSPPPVDEAESIDEELTA